MEKAMYRSGSTRGNVGFYCQEKARYRSSSARGSLVLDEDAVFEEQAVKPWRTVTLPSRPVVTGETLVR